MGRKCRECGVGVLDITGMGPYQDTIEVECRYCGEFYEVESDGLGEGGMELAEAFEIELERKRQRDREYEEFLAKEDEEDALNESA